MITTEKTPTGTKHRHQFILRIQIFAMPSRRSTWLLLALTILSLAFQYRLLRQTLFADSMSKSTAIADNDYPIIEEDHGRSSSGRRMQSNSSVPTDLMLPPTRKWAYAFLVGGCSEKNPGYKGFLYNVAVSAHILHESGSRSDVVVFVQMSTSTDARKLPADEEQMLRDLGVHVRYLPKFRSSVHETFYPTVMQKFRILELVEYSRVMFMDADMMPLCNLDYMFELSEPNSTSTKPFFKENVIISDHDEACNAGLFIMKPSQENWQSIQQAIRTREEQALVLEWPHWDEVEGWGHKITPPDYWRGMNGTKLTVWVWHAVFADQGLLYYWPKYVQKNVSIIIGPEIETWSSTGEESEVFLEEIMDGQLMKYTCSPTGFRQPPYRDIEHYTGGKKPWTYDLRNSSRIRQKLVFWKEALLRAQTRTNYTFSLNLREELKNVKPPVGAYSTYSGMIKHIRAKQFFNWSQYEDPSDVDLW